MQNMVSNPFLTRPSYHFYYPCPPPYAHILNMLHKIIIYFGFLTNIKLSFLLPLPPPTHTPMVPWNIYMNYLYIIYYIIYYELVLTLLKTERFASPLRCLLNTSNTVSNVYLLENNSFAFDILMFDLALEFVKSFCNK